MFYTYQSRVTKYIQYTMTYETALALNWQGSIMSASSELQQIGVSTNICPYSIELLDAVSNLSRHFHTIEIEIENQIRHSFENDKVTFAEEIKKLLNLKIKKQLNYFLHAPYLGYEIDLSSTNPVIRQEAIWRMMEVIELAVDLKCQEVTHSLYYLNKPLDQPIRFKNLAYSLAKLVFYAKKLNIQLLLEYQPFQADYQVEFDLSDLLLLCREFNLKIALNVSKYHPAFDNEIWYQHVLSKMLPYLSKIYIANTLPINKQVNIVYQKMISYLKQYNFNGKIIIKRENYLSGFGKQQDTFLLATTTFKNDLISIIRQD